MKTRKPHGYWPSIRNQLEIDAQSMSHKQMAEKYDVEYRTIETILSRLGIKTKKLYGDLAEMCKTMTVAQLAEHYGSSTNSVSSMLYQRKLKALPAERVELVYELDEQVRALAATMPGIQIAKELGVGYRRVRNACKRLGVTPAKRVYEIKEKGPKPKRVHKPRPKKELKQTKPAPKITPKQDAKIIMPADVKITVATVSYEVYNPTKHNGMLRAVR